MPTPVEALREAIANATTVVVSGHEGPDGDCIGAALALKAGLEASGKQVRALSNNDVPANVSFLPGADSVVVLRTDEEAMEAADTPTDLAVLVDVGFTRRAGRAGPALQAAAKLAVIDHHEVGAEQSGDIRIIDPSASATCYMLFRLFPELGIEITPRVAECLLTGIVTDTGCFRFGNTDPASLDAAARLIEHGANLAKINEHVWNRRPMAQIDLLRRAFDRLSLSRGGRLAITHITRGDFDESGGVDADTEGIASEVARIDSVDVAAVFREPTPGRVRVSVRSRGDIDVAEVCRQFNGGGHKNAAGCRFDVPVAEAIERMRPALEACLESR